MGLGYEEMVQKREYMEKKNHREKDLWTFAESEPFYVDVQWMQFSVEKGRCKL